MNIVNRPLFKTGLCFFILVQASFGLQAPYLVSATAQGDSGVALIWRNNDIAAQGFTVQRKDSNAAAFKVIESVKSAAVLSYLDKINIRPATLYTYQILAYNSSSKSDTSNSLQTTTGARTAIFKKPGFSVSWNSDTTNFARLVIYDSSNCETGYRIYRANGFSSSYTLISQLASANPAKTDSIVWLDSTLTLNSWSIYKVATFTTADSLFSDPCSTYSFHSDQIAQPVTFTKLSDFAISMDSGLSALSGDSIILKESNSPAGKYSAINVKDPTHLKFDGDVDSVSLLSYPLKKTLLPVFLKYGVVNSFLSKKVCQYSEKMLVLRDSVLKRYKIQNNNLVLIDSMKNFRGNSIFLLDTMALAVLYDSASALLFAEHYFFPILLTGFSLLPRYDLGFSVAMMMGNQEIQPNIQGITNNKIFVSTNIIYGDPTMRMPNKTNEIVYDLSLNRTICLPSISSTLNSSNTGYCISATEYVSTTIMDYVYKNGNFPNTATDLFISDIRNLHSYEFASSRNGVYRDTVHTKDQLRNIILDTAGKKVYLVYSTNLSVLSYQRGTVRAANTINKPFPSYGLIIRPGALGTIIVLPGNCNNADLLIYDVSGSVVERMRNITSNAVLWRPKTSSMKFFIAEVKSGKEQYVSKFIVR